MNIPIIHCFDHNYVLPAAVALQTMLENAKTPNAIYELYAIGSGITAEDKALLARVVAKFPNGRLTFREPPKNPVPEDGISKKGHYSADLYYKLMLPDLFPELNKAIVADVDVVYEDDIAKVLSAFPDEDNCYVAGAWDPGYAAYHREGLFPTGKPLIKKYLRKFTADELEKLRISAGLMVFNMKKLRDVGMAREWIAFAIENRHRAILPEQEPINIVSDGHIATLPHLFMADSTHADEYDRFAADGSFPNSAWREMYASPVMLHFASRAKPWKFPGVPRADRWFAACVRAGLMEEWRKWYAVWSKPIVDMLETRKLIDVTIGVGKRMFNLQLTKR